MPQPISWIRHKLERARATLTAVSDGKLRTAALNGEVDKVSLVLQKGKARVNSKDSWGHTALYYALGSCESVGLGIQVADVLFAHGAKIRDELLCASITSLQKQEVTRWLLEHGANTETRTSGDEGLTPLGLAIKLNELETARMLLSHHASVHAKDRLGRTPLHLARSSQAVTLLLDHGARVNAQDKHHHTPLYTACVSNLPYLAQALLESGAILSKEILHDAKKHHAFRTLVVLHRWEAAQSIWLLMGSKQTPCKRLPVDLWREVRKLLSKSFPGDQNLNFL